MSEVIEKVIVNKEDLEELADSVRAAKSETGTYQWDVLKASAIEIIGSSGGESIETCTVRVELDGTATKRMNAYCATIYNNGENKISTQTGTNISLPFTIENVICGSCIAIDIASDPFMTNNGLEFLYIGETSGFYFKVIAAAGGEAVFIVS